MEVEKSRPVNQRQLLLETSHLSLKHDYCQETKYPLFIRHNDVSHHRIKSSPMSRIYVTESLRHVAQRTPRLCRISATLGSQLEVHIDSQARLLAQQATKNAEVSAIWRYLKCEIREIPLWLRTGVWPTTLLLHSSYKRRADFSIDRLLERKRSTRELSIWFLMFRCWSQPWKPTVTSGVKDLVASQISWNIRPYQDKSYPFCRVESTNSSAVCRTHFCILLSCKKNGQVSTFSSDFPSTITDITLVRKHVKIWNHPILTSIYKWLALGFQMSLDFPLPKIQSACVTVWSRRAAFQEWQFLRTYPPGKVT